MIESLVGLRERLAHGDRKAETLVLDDLSEIRERCRFWPKKGPCGCLMSNVIRSPNQAASREMIAKLVKAGYLQPALFNDADAITSAIAQMKQDLRGRGGDDGGSKAA